MLINGTDISLYQAKQHTVTIEYSEIRNESDWQSYAAVPFLDRNKTGFKEWSVVLIVKGGRERRDHPELFGYPLPAHRTG